jgi:hypothetical protein
MNQIKGLLAERTRELTVAERDKVATCVYVYV